MREWLEIIGTAGYILAGIALPLAWYWRRQAANRQATGAPTAPQLLDQLVTYTMDRPPLSAAALDRIAELESIVKGLRRDFADLDEATERRFNRLQARTRRDVAESAAPAVVAAPPLIDPRQQLLDFAAASASAATGEPAPDAPAERPPLRRIGRHL